jgi:acyl-CoA oxidase
MTELRSGSNIPAFETTATYDVAREEFLLETPTLGATKWWIGGAAHTATHSAVFAQLLVRGKRLGVRMLSRV